MIKIKVFSINKTKESWLEEALSEYEKRLTGAASIEWVFAKSDEQLERMLAKERGYLCLTPEGKPYTSSLFSARLISWVERLGSQVAFVIGGAEGLPAGIKRGALGLISLSQMTFTHQMTRLILIEQIYRAFEIQRGSGYDK